MGHSCGCCPWGKNIKLSLFQHYWCQMGLFRRMGSSWFVSSTSPAKTKVVLEFPCILNLQRCTTLCWLDRNPPSQTAWPGRVFKSGQAGFSSIYCNSTPLPSSVAARLFHLWLKVCATPSSQRYSSITRLCVSNLNESGFWVLSGLSRRDNDPQYSYPSRGPYRTRKRQHWNSNASAAGFTVIADNM